MLSSTLLSLLPLLAATSVVAQNTSTANSPTTGLLGNASVVENNPVGVVYQAKLPETAFDKNAFPNGGNVIGEVNATSSPNGIGVVFSVKFSNLPSTGGPFLYHIHVDPVPDSGNCTETLAHLDPYIRGESPACNGTLKQTCQVGDLSGKYGKIEPDSNNSFEANYTDLWASTYEGIGSYFGNRSLVVHFANTTRITCASFQDISGGDENPTTVSTSATGTGGSNSTAPAATSTPTTTPVIVNAAASARFTGAALFLSISVAFAFVL